MRLPIWAVPVIALLAGHAHAQSHEIPSSQGIERADAVVDQYRGDQSGIAQRDGAAVTAEATSGAVSPGALDPDQHSGWHAVLARSIATGQRQLQQIWGLLGERDGIPPLLTLFNGLVAIFAYWLWRSTSGLIGLAREQSRDMKEMIVVAREAADAAKRSAEAASLQARAMVGTELPRFELGHVHLACSDQSVRQALKAPSVDLRLINYGRTTALVVEKCVEVRLGRTLPSDPAYDFVEALPVVEAVESGKSVGIDAHRRLGDLSESQVEGLLSGLNNIWVYGFVRFRDFLGMEHQTGFCLRWTPPHREASTGGSFVQENPGAYVYQDDHWPVETERSPSTRHDPGLRLAAAAE